MADARLRELDRALVTGDYAAGERLLRALDRAGPVDVDYLVQLRRRLPDECFGFEEDQDPYSPCAKLARLASRLLWRQGIGLSGRSFRRPARLWLEPDYNDSSWLVYELDETRYWADRIQESVVAIGGAYLTDTSRRVYIASTVPSLEVYAMCASVHDHWRVEDRDEEIENEWIRATEPIDYADYNRVLSGRGAINWRYLRQDYVQGIAEYAEEGESLAELLISDMHANGGCPPW